jgi:hypothetical protein
VLTFREFIAAYMNDIAAQVSAKTATEYRRTATKHLLPIFGSTRLNEITIPAVKAFETKLKRAGYALSTVNGYVNVLLILLRRAVDDFDLIEDFPLKKRLKRPKREKSREARAERARSRSSPRNLGDTASRSVTGRLFL